MEILADFLNLFKLIRSNEHDLEWNDSVSWGCLLPLGGQVQDLGLGLDGGVEIQEKADFDFRVLTIVGNTTDIDVRRRIFRSHFLLRFDFSINLIIKVSSKIEIFELLFTIVNKPRIFSQRTVTFIRSLT